jgi:hypothetical protein
MVARSITATNRRRGSNPQKRKERDIVLDGSGVAIEGAPSHVVIVAPMGRRQLIRAEYWDSSGIGTLCGAVIQFRSSAHCLARRGWAIVRGHLENLAPVGPYV